MALSEKCIKSLASGFANRDCAISIKTVVDADSGTVSANDRHRLESVLGLDDTVNFLAKVNSGVGGVMLGKTELRLRQIMGVAAANEFIAAVAANA